MARKRKIKVKLDRKGLTVYEKCPVSMGEAGPPTKRQRDLNTAYNSGHQDGRMLAARECAREKEAADAEGRQRAREARVEMVKSLAQAISSMAQALDCSGNL